MAQKWRKLRFLKYENCVIHWKGWRTRHDSNVRPSVPQTVLAGIQGQSVTNKNNNIRKLIDFNY